MGKNDFVSLQKLQQIASGTALTNGLIPAPREEIARMYYTSEKKLLPIIKRCDAGTLWVDRYYVAYQIGDGDVHYTYISKHHLTEEVLAYRAASQMRDVLMEIPPSIQRCFHVAKQKMQTTGIPYWIAPPWSEKRCANNRSEQK